MTATTRWVEFSTTASGSADTGNGAAGKGTRGYTQSDSGSGDSFSISSTNNRLYITVDGGTEHYITIMSGTNLDPRLIARDISEKMHNTAYGGGWDFAQCAWENNVFKLYSGTLGSSSSMAVASGTNTAHTTLGWSVASASATGSGTINTYPGDITISGTNGGFFDEIYKVVISSAETVGTPVRDGSNTATADITAVGAFNNSSDIVYYIDIDVTNGTTMGAGTGNVPTLTWTSTGNVDDNPGDPIELLYPNYWYHIGTKGLMVKFSDGVFVTCDDAWTVSCTAPVYAQGTNTNAAVGTAKYIYCSSRGDASSLNDGPETTVLAGFSELGKRGLYVGFDSGTLYRRDEFYVLCKGPQPTSYGISNVYYGNVTISTDSPVKCVMFEVTSGAVEISTVKFGLQSHGSFNHHDENNDDTYFRFGTVGPGNNASSTNIEWRANVSSSDISSDTPPSYLYATKENLSVVSDADNSESIGYSAYCGMTSDPIFIGIHLGASEVGANSTMNYRCYFDYS